METFLQTLGILGAILLAFGYLLISNKQLGSDSHRYHLLNLVGSLFIAISSFYFNAWGPVILNIF